jgi:hypothetical protein
MTTGIGKSVWYQDSDVWRFVFMRYLAVFAPASFLWEIAQLPLYKLWSDASPASIAYAVIHCTLGDVLIGVLALLAALVVTRAGALCQWRWKRVGSVALFFGFAYTAYSEWLNTAVLMNWAYSDLMPITPVLALGLSPLLQWLILPTVALLVSRRAARSARRTSGA